MSSPSIPTRQLIPLRDAAAQLGVHPRTLRRYITEGRITGYRIGDRRVVLDVADLDQLAQPIPAVAR